MGFLNTVQSVDEDEEVGAQMTVDMQFWVETILERVKEEEREEFRERIKGLKEFSKWRNLVKCALGSIDQAKF